MTGSLFQYFNVFWLITACIVFLVALRVKAPYGRHTLTSWGPLIDNKLGWFVMELPAFLLPLYFCFTSPSTLGVVSLIMLFWISFHYFNRVFIYPIRIKTKGKKIPIVIVLFALIFNAVNGSNIGYFLGHYTSYYTTDWLYDIRFITGTILFILGMIINWKSDTILINLRKPGETGYKVPKGFLFKYVSCPNHLGEIIEWIGFALLTWALPSLVFAVWTIANLVPRSINHHNWYQDEFPAYPKERKAVIPFLV